MHENGILKTRFQSRQPFLKRLASINSSRLFQSDTWNYERKNNLSINGDLVWDAQTAQPASELPRKLWTSLNWI